PFDYMGAKTMAYQPNTNGGYLLYSVGEDEKDDGGDPTCLGKPPATLWNGRDAVWPTAAGETNGSGK
ncbi:MAG: hypothetical protein NT154_01605, partial [Verrucomicrobia bacterium]|nr:hypothetical protein [Verrucomicrobiota bacterium]